MSDPSDIDLDDAAVITQALMWWEFNVSPSHTILVVYGEPNPAYLGSKSQILKRMGLLGLWAELDSEHRERLLKAVLKRYEKDSRTFCAPEHKE